MNRARSNEAHILFFLCFETIFGDLRTHLFCIDVWAWTWTLNSQYSILIGAFFFLLDLSWQPKILLERSWIMSKDKSYFDAVQSHHWHAISWCSKTQSPNQKNRLPVQFTHTWNGYSELRKEKKIKIQKLWSQMMK